MLSGDNVSRLTRRCDYVMAFCFVFIWCYYFYSVSTWKLIILKNKFAFTVTVHVHIWYESTRMRGDYEIILANILQQKGYFLTCKLVLLNYFYEYCYLIIARTFSKYLFVICDLFQAGTLHFKCFVSVNPFNLLWY